MEQIDTILKYPYPKPKAERVSKSLEAISSEVYNFSKLKQQKLDRVAGIKKAKEVFIEKTINCLWYFYRLSFDKVL